MEIKLTKVIYLLLFLSFHLLTLKRHLAFRRFVLIFERLGEGHEEVDRHYDGDDDASNGGNGLEAARGTRKKFVDITLKILPLVKTI